MENVLTNEPLLILGLILGIGYFLATIFKRLHVPNVISFIFAGFILGNFVFETTFHSEQMETWFHIAEELALGLIGFEIGTELKISRLKENPKVLSVLLLSEVFGAFVVIFSLVFVFTQNFLLAFILGGIGTATAPAATIEIIRRSRSKGQVTTMLQWMLAFDDVVAIIFVEGILAYLVTIIHGAFSITSYLSALFQEIGVAFILGMLIGLILDFFVETFIKDELELMEFTFGFIIFGMGAAIFLHTSVITTTMVMGAFATNSRGDNYETAKDLLEYTMSPAIAIFFVLVGAQVFLSDFSPFPLIALIYLIGRSIGKVFGSYFGASVLHEPEPLRSNLGLGLLAQGGVALGLVTEAQTILVQSTDPNIVELGHIIISTVVISTIFSEILGALGTTFSLKRSNEFGKGPLKETKRATYMHE